MDNFFACVATLMSNNLRRVVENSLDDLVSLFDVYKNGNAFKGEFIRSLPVIPQPIIITLVSVGVRNSGLVHFFAFGRMLEFKISTYFICQINPSKPS